MGPPIDRATVALARNGDATPPEVAVALGEIIVTFDAIDPRGVQ